MEQAASITAEQHLDEQLQRFELEFNPITDELMVRNTSTTASWDRVVISIMNRDEGPIAAFRDPRNPSDESPYVEDLGRVEAGDVRVIGAMRWSGPRYGRALLELTCSRGDRSWRVQRECHVPQALET